jgi:hypothetical protein
MLAQHHSLSNTEASLSCETSHEKSGLIARWLIEDDKLTCKWIAAKHEPKSLTTQLAAQQQTPDVKPAKYQEGLSAFPRRQRLVSAHPTE